MQESKLMDWLISDLQNRFRLFSHRRGQSQWPDVQQSLTPAQGSAMFSSSAQVSLFWPSVCVVLPSNDNTAAALDRFLFQCYFPLISQASPQVQRVWCVQRRWGKRALPIASSCAPWTNILHMTGLNWVRFVHRPWPRTLTLPKKVT